MSKKAMKQAVKVKYGGGKVKHGGRKGKRSGGKEDKKRTGIA